MSIFKAYDIRGKYPIELNEEIAYKVGRAFVSFLKCKKVVVGYDMRLSSENLKRALIDGITEQGADAIDIGLSSTDLLYFVVGNFKYEAGIIVTASHNPKEYNGFKLVSKGVGPVKEGDGMEEIRGMAEKGSFRSSFRKGSITKKDYLADFAKFTRSFVDLKRIKPMKVVMDASNGMAGRIAPKIFEGLPLDKTEMFFQLDGSFPNHESNPLIEENRRECVKNVKRLRADLGIMWDGDTDRTFFIDENGNFLQGDFITGLLAKQVLLKKKNAMILYDLRASRFVPDTIRKYGGRSRECRVGHAFFKKYMREEDSPFGGEVTGHYYYKCGDYYAENGFAPALQIMELMSTSGKKLSQLLLDEGAGNYFISGEINYEVKDKNQKMEELKQRYSDAEISYLDGITIKYKDWWFNVRPSNTEPLLRLNLEASTKEMMEKKLREVQKILS